jgi:hypothetical protein
MFNLIPSIMKTKLLTVSAMATFSISTLFAQDKTTVTAQNVDISDNLDLRAVATVFGDASDLEDFERRLNDTKSQISNLDLNKDNYVDYLRVIESIEENAHLVIIQAVIDKDVYQDVATIEVERDSNNRVQVQVVGDVYLYGTNYIYEPIYVHTPIIYNTFWVRNYRPYYSSWYWNFYPSYYSYWNPYSIFRYKNHIHAHIHFGHSYHYVTNRRCQIAYASYYGRRGNGYERMHPNRSFTSRNSGYNNRKELDNNRNFKLSRSRGERVRNNARMTISSTGGNSGTRTETRTPRNNETRTATSIRVNTIPRITTENRNTSTRGSNTRVYSENRNNSSRERSSVSNSSTRNNSETRGSTSGRSSKAQRSASSSSSSSRTSGRG